MKEFKVLKHPDGRSKAVKQGWCWPAFWFGSIWALVSRLWLVAGVTFAGVFSFGFMLGLLGVAGTPEINGVMNFLGLVIALVFGSYGNTWRESKLVDSGYEFATTVQAKNKDGAIALSLK